MRAQRTMERTSTDPTHRQPLADGGWHHRAFLAVLRPTCHPVVTRRKEPIPRHRLHRPCVCGVAGSSGALAIRHARRCMSFVTIRQRLRGGLPVFCHCLRAASPAWSERPLCSSCGSSALPCSTDTALAPAWGGADLLGCVARVPYSGTRGSANLRIHLFELCHMLFNRRLRWHGSIDSFQLSVSF